MAGISEGIFVGTQIYSGTVAGTKTAVHTKTYSLIYGVCLHNATAAVAYLQVYDLPAASVTVGTTTPTFSIGIPASGSVVWTIDDPIIFVSGLTIACTTTRAGASGANVDVNLTYNAVD